METSSLRSVSMSRTCGMFSSTTSSSVRRAAAMQGRAEFFEPLTRTVPRRGLPPRITNLSMVSGFSLNAETEEKVAGCAAEKMEARSQLLLCGGLRSRRRLGFVLGPDDFAGPRIVQAFARLVLNGVGIGLEFFHLLLESAVLLLQVGNALLDRAPLGPLLRVHVHAVFAKKSAVAEEERHGNDHARGDAEAHAVNKP